MGQRGGAVGPHVSPPHTTAVKGFATKRIVMKLKQYIASKKLIVNGDPSPCQCTDTITCAYCVQTNLLALEKKFKTDESTTNNIITYIKRNGLRQTARDLNVNHNAVRYWLKSRNVPQWVVGKYAGVDK